MRGDRVGVGIGLFFVAAGVLFLLEGLDVLRVRAALLWPLLLIGLGIALLLGGIRREEPESAAEDSPPAATAEAAVEPPPPKLGEREDQSREEEPPG